MQVKVPMLIMPSGEDPDHLPLKEVLDKKPFGDKCEYRRFDDMHHGFCAGRYYDSLRGALAEASAVRNTRHDTPTDLLLVHAVRMK